MYIYFLQFCREFSVSTRTMRSKRIPILCLLLIRGIFVQVIPFSKKTYKENTLLYKIYRLLKFKPFVSHSSFGEEILVNRLLNNIPKGFFVDVGAFNPKVGSMTYELYKKGWNGINIDFSEENIRLFKFFRKRDISLSKIVSNKNSFLKTYSFDPSSGANTVEKEIADGWSRNFNKKYIINEQESKTLDSI